VLYPLENNTMV